MTRVEYPKSNHTCPPCFRPPPHMAMMRIPIAALGPAPYALPPI